MNKIFSLAGALTIASAVAFSWSQEVKVDEKSISFNNGSHSAVVVTIPYASKDVVEKELKGEMKDWGGKFESTKGEYIALGASMKSMGDKPFDGYAKVIESGDGVQVAFAVDLGGAYMSNGAHSAQYATIKEKAKKFGVKAATEGVAAELATEAKVLKDMEKEKSDLEKTIESSKKDIEDYKQKIIDAEQRIKDSESALGKNGESIASQASKIAEVEKKKKSIK